MLTTNGMRERTPAWIRQQVTIVQVNGSFLEKTTRQICVVKLVMLHAKG